MPVTQAQRNHMVELCSLLNTHAAQVFWDEIRPMSTARITEQQLTRLLQSGGTITTDCDETCTLICRLAGLKDPNGNGYDGKGWTGDLLKHLPHFTDPRKIHAGTLIVLGNYPGLHVVMVTAPNAKDPGNPRVYSHGSHANSAIWDLNTERTYHPAGTPINLLAIASL